MASKKTAPQTRTPTSLESLAAQLHVLQAELAQLQAVSQDDPQYASHTIEHTESQIIMIGNILYQNNVSAMPIIGADIIVGTVT